MSARVSCGDCPSEPGYLHDPKTGNAENDLKHAQEAADTGKLGICPTATNLDCAGWEHHDVADSTDTRQGTQKNVVG